MRTIMSRFIVTVGVVVAALAFASSASAETTGPEWKILSVANPTNFKPGDRSGDDAIVVTAVNVGGASTGCTAEQIAAEPRPVFSPLRPCPAGSPVVSPVTISDTVPSGMTAVEVYGDDAYQDPIGELAEGTVESFFGEDNGPPAGLACTLSSRTPSCTTGEPVSPGDTLVVTIRVHVETEVQGLGEVNRASVAGGGAVGVSVSDPVTVSSTPAGYGLAGGGVLSAVSSTQAGGHPNFTAEFFLNTISQEPIPGTEGAFVESVSPPKDVDLDLPRGLLGTTVGVARCSMADVVDSSECPRNTMVGVATVMVGPAAGGKPRVILTTPVYNIAPAPGEPLAFAFEALFFPVRIDASLLSDGEFNARVSATGLTGAASVTMTSITIWGDPAEHSGAGPDTAAKTVEGNQFLRPEGHRSASLPEFTFGGPGTEEVEISQRILETVDQRRQALLTNATQCSESLTDVLETDSWEAPGEFKGAGTAETGLGTPTGCGQLSFKPEVSMLPDTLEAGAPAGYAFHLSVPQNSEAEGLATPHVKRVVVTLPLGTVVSPSVSDGLGDCTTEQFFGPADERGQARPATLGDCPRDSQVGTVRVKTPNLEEQLTGEVYLGAPECTGVGGVCTPQDASDGKMIRLFQQFVGEGEDGVVVKLEGTGSINQQTGQLTFTFNEAPQLPFSELKLTLAGGERASLANPRSCGTVTTTADLTPWSTPFTPDATPTSSFDVDENCFGAQFNPTFTAGTVNNQAGEASTFTLAFGRSDEDELLNGLQLKLPPGFWGPSRRSRCAGNHRPGKAPAARGA